ncbi:MAG: hypothetical protein LBJ94_03190 [Puniceicoccales bacterium]|jgi:hypothetical protein|nr:hypothetical protein [Puniceicoccales bacterium]
MNLLSFIVLATTLLIFSALLFEQRAESLCAIPSKFNRVLWCQKCDHLEISEKSMCPCSRCGGLCTVIKF